MTRRRRKPSAFRITLLVILIGAALYVNQVVVPATPPLFYPTTTPTRSPESYVNQAKDLYAAGKIEQAIEAYKQAITSDPTNASNYVELARLQILFGEYEEAIVNAQNAQLKNPNNPMAIGLEGWANISLEKYEVAEQRIKEALELDPNSAVLHAYLAEALIYQVLNNQRTDLLDKAIEESQTAMQLGGDQLEVLRTRGLVLYLTGNHEEAIEVFKAAIGINKNIYDLHLYLGLAYKASEQYGLAQEALLSAVAINSKDPDAYTELSRAYFAGGQFAPAAQYAEEAIKVDPTNPRLHGNLGYIYYRMDEHNKAIPELSLAVRGGIASDGAAVEGLPLDYEQRIMEYYVYYGFSLMKSGRCSEAMPIFNALLSGVPNDETTVFNANFGITTCENGGATPTPEATEEEGGDQG